jgi:hypothetical protein
MKVSIPFVNMIVGTARGFRGMSINAVEDEAVFTIPEYSTGEFPLATTVSYPHRPDLVECTHFKDGHHWYFPAKGIRDTPSARDGNLARFVAETYDIKLPTRFEMKWKPFPPHTVFRTVEEDFRDETVDLIQEYCHANLAMVEGTLAIRTAEPRFGVMISAPLPFEEGQPQLSQSQLRHPSRRTRATHAFAFAPHQQRYVGNPSHLFRADDVDGLLEAMDFLAQGGTRMWNNPRIDIHIPESITLEAERLSALIALENLRLHSYHNVKDMGYEQLDAWCLVKDVAEIEPEDDRIEAALMAGRRISRMVDQPGMPIHLDFAIRRWENRPVRELGITTSMTLA